MYLRPDGRVWTVVDGLRDYSIADPKQRELKLQQDLRAFYPAYHPIQGGTVPPLPAVPPGPTKVPPGPMKAPHPVHP